MLAWGKMWFWRRRSKVFWNKVRNLFEWGNVRNGKKFNEKRTGVHYEDGQRRQSVVSVGFIQHVDLVIRVKQKFTSNEFSYIFY